LIHYYGKFNIALLCWSRSLKAGGADKRSVKAAPSSFGLKSDERAEKRKEVPIKTNMIPPLPPKKISIMQAHNFI